MRFFLAGVKLAQPFLADGEFTRDLLGVAVQGAAAAMEFAYLSTQMTLLRANLFDTLGQLGEGLVIALDALFEFFGYAVAARQLAHGGMPVITAPVAQHRTQIVDELGAFVGALGLFAKITHARGKF